MDETDETNETNEMDEMVSVAMRDQVNTTMVLYELKNNSFSLEENNPLTFSYLNRLQYSINDSLGKPLGRDDLVIGAILKPYHNYNRVIDKPLLFSETHFNPVNFSYTYPDSRPVYLITMYIYDKRLSEVLIYHYGTYYESTRDKLFNLYGFTHSKRTMNTVKTLMTLIKTMDPDENYYMLASHMTWIANSAAMRLDKIITYMRDLFKANQDRTDIDTAVREIVDEIDIKITKDIDPEYSEWIVEPKNQLMIDVVKDMLEKAAAEKAEAEMAEAEKAEVMKRIAEEQEAFLKETNGNDMEAPMTAVAARANVNEQVKIYEDRVKELNRVQADMKPSIGGKRHKTRRKIRKTKTHKRKSNKKMRRSRKSRRRHKKK